MCSDTLKSAGLEHFPPNISPEIDDKSCLNRSWTDERSLYYLEAGLMKELFVN